MRSLPRRRSAPLPPALLAACVAAGVLAGRGPARADEGQWLPEQIRHLDFAALKARGLELGPEEIWNGEEGLLTAAAQINGCSSSFVSARGLIVTNHHCSVGALQFNSTPASNLMKNGYLAKSQRDELSAGPTARVQLTRSFREVSNEVRAALEGVSDDLGRQRAFEKFQKERVAACEKDRPEVRCELKSFYVGLRYFMIEQLELRDVRIVYAPPAGIGNFGGEVDNWRWPRHTGDFAFFRAYWGKDGKPADFAAENGIDEGHAKALHRHGLLWTFTREMPAWTQIHMAPSDDGQWLVRMGDRVVFADDYPGLGHWPPKPRFWQRRGRGAATPAGWCRSAPSSLPAWRSRSSPSGRSCAGRASATSSTSSARARCGHCRSSP